MKLAENTKKILSLKEEFELIEGKLGGIAFDIEKNKADLEKAISELELKKAELKNTFGEIVSNNNLTQLRIAETEKYAHVTFFFNGGEEKQYKGEERILVPSPKVETYDMQPEMSAYEVTDKVVEAIKSQKYDTIIL